MCIQSPLKQAVPKPQRQEEILLESSSHYLEWMDQYLEVDFITVFIIYSQHAGACAER